MKQEPAKIILFDLDGTLYLDGVPYPGAIELIEKLRDSDLEYCFVTNNSSIAPPDYCEKLRKIGFPLEPRNVMSSCEAAELMLKTLGIGPEIYIMGTQKLRTWLEGRGFVHTFDKAKAVLMGFDRELTFTKLNEATRLVLNDVPVYATHPDYVCPPDLPDVGMLMEAIKAAKPGTIIHGIAGKPHRWLAKCLEQRFGVPASQMVMVGDRINTDMRFAHNNGMRSMLVLNGAPMPLLEEFEPTVVVPNIAQLMDEFWPHNLGW